MLDEEGKPHTAHTSNPVPFVLTVRTRIVEWTEGCPMAPTILALLGLEAPLQMTGKNLT